MNQFTYNPPPTLDEFMSNTHRVAAVRGPVGSAKSTAMVMRLLMESTLAPVQADGVRRSKMVIVRNTLQQLKTTCLVTIEQLLRPIIHHRVSDSTIQLRVPGIESDWLMLPLDTPQNQQRLLSLELTWAWISEFREIDPEIVEAVLSRCGRYPSRAMIAEEDRNYRYGIIMETNSFSEDSPWNDLLENRLPPNWGYYVQPGAFDEGAENRENLPPSYYEDLLESNSEEWAEQYIHNRITPSLSGQAVFRTTFSREFHTTDEELVPSGSSPLIIGMDTGRNPAAVVAQLDGLGRLLVFMSLWRENMGMQKFLSEVVTPALQEERFLRVPAYLVLDPACRQRSQIGEESVLGCCLRLGYQAIPAMTNDIKPRLRAVERFLIEQRGGKAAMLIQDEGNEDLIHALSSGYRYKRKKLDGSLEEVPEKNHPASDLCFVAGTPVAVAGADVPIETLKCFDEVLTPVGLRRVVAVGSRRVSEVINVELSSGVTLTCTPNHPFVMADGCVLRADELQYGFVLEGIEWQKPESSGSTGGDTQGTRGTGTSGTSGTVGRSQCTETFGLKPTAKFQTGWWSITRITTPPTTGWRTWRFLRTVHTAVCTWRVASIWDSAHLPDGGRLSGTALKRGVLCTASKVKSLGLELRRLSTDVLSAGVYSWLTQGRLNAAFVGCHVSRKQEKPVVLMTSSEPVQSATASLSPTNTQRSKHVLKVVGVSRSHEQREVYNITVEGVHKYYAGGALVLNCDALQYTCLGTAAALRGRIMWKFTVPKEVKKMSSGGWT